MDDLLISAGTEADIVALQLAYAERAKSDDPKSIYVSQSGVGAVIVCRGGEITRSANVLPPRLKKAHLVSDIVVTEHDRYHVIEHAERATIFKALLDGKNLEGATLYCTRLPCSDCARAIIWVGITRVVSGAGLKDEARWLEAQRAALNILKDSGVEVTVVEFNAPSGSAPNFQQSASAAAERAIYRLDYREV